VNEEIEEPRHIHVDERETGRVEAFSDGVFAIAITLLVLDLKIPEITSGDTPLDDLGPFLLKNWPYYLAFLTSFATIGIMWINHHRLFTHIKRSDNMLLVLNNLLLLGVTVVPWPTSLVALYLGPQGADKDKALATMLYSGWFVVISIFYNLLWRYASSGNRLLGRRADRRTVGTITRQYLAGPLVYAVAFFLALLGLWLPPLIYASVWLNLALAIYFALPSTNRLISRRSSQPPGEYFS
jgi:TMEM175 potassium channel family protein